MNKMRIAMLTCLVAIIAPAAALCQSGVTFDQQSEERTTSGTIVSSNANTMVVKADSGQCVLFVLDRGTERPRGLPAGARVVVTSTPGDEPGVQIAIIVTTPEIAEAANVPAKARRATTASASTAAG